MVSGGWQSGSGGELWSVRSVSVWVCPASAAGTIGTLHGLLVASLACANRDCTAQRGHQVRRVDDLHSAIRCMYYLKLRDYFSRHHLKKQEAFGKRRLLFHYFLITF